MSRTLTFAAALATSAALLTAATSAEAQTAHYVAKPEAQTGKASVVTRSTPWALRDGVYVAARAPERPVVLCQLLARDVGRLQSFAVAGAPLDAEALAKCNSRAKGGAGVAVAAAGAPSGGR